MNLNKDNTPGQCIIFFAVFFSLIIYCGYCEITATECAGTKNFEVTYLHISGQEKTTHINVCDDVRDFYVTTYKGAYVLCADRANGPVTGGIANEIVLRGATDIIRFKLIKQ